VQCSGWADPEPRTATLSALGEDMAAARALEALSRRLADRAGQSRARFELEEDGV
jgi:hypothetical protein